ncbi:hypothetical protein GOP47_0020289 [Adiantum capillus-veneris]|uniref:Uncharacterized protein n=1 Tax=Adiantum capillus-veneris TaxID=13818 RepID=A0A9D4UBL9_ADICA|nr:hypothetical protein GOP47_0019739 [Adiantum capillus-veneris]KAI5065594.1 hypothetical protein GOP47_0020289 [Adiantum capillus-veneris]
METFAPGKQLLDYPSLGRQATHGSVCLQPTVPTPCRKHEGPTLAFLDSPAALHSSRISTIAPSARSSLQLCVRNPVEGEHKFLNLSTTSIIEEVFVSRDLSSAIWPGHIEGASGFTLQTEDCS